MRFSGSLVSALIVCGVLTTAVSCYNPDLKSGQQRCDRQKRCADGFTCFEADGLCYRSGDLPDASVSGCAALSCSAPTPVCDPATMRCVACLPNNNRCSSPTPNCKSVDGTWSCVADAVTCTKNEDCEPSGDASAATRLCCNGLCIARDASNCGMCGAVCSLPNATSACNRGVCVVEACSNGFGDCDVTAAGCESALTTTDNCGRCGNQCAGGPNVLAPSCVAGRCVNACADGFADCNSQPGCESTRPPPKDCTARTDKVDPNAKYVICRADCNEAVISSAAGAMNGTFQANQICKDLGYAGGRDLWANPGQNNVCGSQVGSTCTNPGPEVIWETGSTACKQDGTCSGAIMWHCTN